MFFENLIRLQWSSQTCSACSYQYCRGCGRYSAACSPRVLLNLRFSSFVLLSSPMFVIFACLSLQIATRLRHVVQGGWRCRSPPALAMHAGSLNESSLIYVLAAVDHQGLADGQNFRCGFRVQQPGASGLLVALSAAMSSLIVFFRPCPRCKTICFRDSDCPHMCAAVSLILHRVATHSCWQCVRQLLSEFSN